MKKKLLHKAADRVWYWFDEYRGGDYDNDWEKVGAFSEFVDELAEDAESLLSIAGINTTHDYVARALYKVIDRGINHWYGDPIADLRQALSTKLN